MHSASFEPSSFENFLRDKSCVVMQVCDIMKGILLVKEESPRIVSMMMVVFQSSHHSGQG